MFILKHGSKQAKPFIKSVVIGTTGLDVTFSEESKAMKFVSRWGSYPGRKCFKKVIRYILSSRN